MSRNHQGKQSATQSKPTESTDLIPLLPEEIKAFTQRAAKGQLLSFFWRDRGQDGTWHQWKGKIEGVGATADTLGVRFSPGFRLVKSLVGKIIEFPTKQITDGKVDVAAISLSDDVWDVDPLQTPPPEKLSQERSETETDIRPRKSRRFEEDVDSSQIIAAQQDQAAGFKIPMRDLVPGLRIPLHRDTEAMALYPDQWFDAGEDMLEALKKRFGTLNYQDLKTRDNAQLDEMLLTEILSVQARRVTRRHWQPLFQLVARLVSAFLLASSLGTVEASLAFQAAFDKGFLEGRIDLNMYLERAMRDHPPKNGQKGSVQPPNQTTIPVQQLQLQQQQPKDHTTERILNTLERVASQLNARSQPQHPQRPFRDNGPKKKPGGYRGPRW